MESGAAKSASGEPRMPDGTGPGQQVKHVSPRNSTMFKNKNDFFTTWPGAKHKMLDTKQKKSWTLYTDRGDLTML